MGVSCMPPEDSQYPLDWLHIAERDFVRVERLLAIDDAQAAGFFLQQAIEKFLKAYLLSRGWIIEDQRIRIRGGD